MLFPSKQEAPSGLTAASPAKLSRAEDSMEFLLVDVMYLHFRVDTVVSALQDEQGKRYLPLRRLSTALGFRIQVEAEKGRASGFLSTPVDRIDIDAKLGTCKRNKSLIHFQPQLCFERDKDLYVESELLARTTGLKFSWRIDKLELEVRSDTPLALQQQWAVRRFVDLNYRLSQLEKQPYDTVRAPYRLWSPPALDFQLYNVADFSRDDSTKTSTPSLGGVGDLLYMGAKYRFSTDGDGRPWGMLTLSRTNSRGQLLGPLRARELLVGDLVLPPVPLLSKGRVGYGVSISNFPVNGDAFVVGPQIEGSAPPKTLVELYRDGFLLDATRADDDGHYGFSGIRLESGPNDLRLVLIGPEGQIQEEQRTLYGDASGLRPGQTRYRMSASKAGRTMLGSEGFGEKAHSWLEFGGELQTGLTSGSWLSLTGTQFEGSDYFGLGYHSWTGGTLWHVQSLTTPGGAATVSAGLSRKFGSSMVSLEHANSAGVLNGGLFTDSELGATSATRLRIDGMANEKRHPYSYGLSVSRLEGSDPSTDIRARLSGSFGTMFFSNSLTTRLTEGAMEGSGLLQVRRKFGNSYGRLEYGYGWGKNSAFQLARISMDRRLTADYRVHFGLEDDVSNNYPYAAIATAYRMFGAVGVGINLNASAGGLKTSLMLSTGLGASSSSESVTFARPGTASSARVRIRAYIDKNLSGTYDKGDVLLPGVGFKVAGHPVPTRTGKLGLCTLDRLAADQEVSFALNEDTFEDPSWIASVSKIVTVPRPGSTITLNMAVLETAELEGSVVEPETVLRAHPQLEAQLYSTNGIKSFTSLIDTQGSFVFSRVIPGEYTLRLTDALGQIIAEQPITAAPGAIVKGVEVIALNESEIRADMAQRVYRGLSRRPTKQNSPVRSDNPANKGPQSKAVDVPRKADFMPSKPVSLARPKSSEKSPFARPTATESWDRDWGERVIPPS